MEKAFAEIIDTLTSIKDPIERDKAAATWLDRIPELQKALSDVRQSAAFELKNDRGMSLAQIATALDVSRARAQQLVAGRPRN